MSIELGEPVPPETLPVITPEHFESPEQGTRDADAFEMNEVGLTRLAEIAVVLRAISPEGSHALVSRSALETYAKLLEYNRFDSMDRSTFLTDIKSWLRGNP